MSRDEGRLGVLFPILNFFSSLVSSENRVPRSVVRIMAACVQADQQIEAYRIGRPPPTRNINNLKKTKKERNAILHRTDRFPHFPSKFVCHFRQLEFASPASLPRRAPLRSIDQAMAAVRYPLGVSGLEREALVEKKRHKETIETGQSPTDGMFQCFQYHRSQLGEPTPSLGVPRMDMHT